MSKKNEINEANGRVLERVTAQVRPPVGPLEAFEPWREIAMHKALRACDTRTALVMREVRDHVPGAAQFLFGCHRSRLLEFMHAWCEASSLLRGSCRVGNEDEEGEAGNWPFLAWYQVRWEGTSLEVALLPGGGAEELVLCVGPNDKVVSSFARAAQDDVQRPRGRSLRYATKWHDAPDLDAELGQVTWDDLVLPAATLAGLHEAVEGFAAGRELYHALGMAWRRGVLLVGPPGTGKTMICKAVASALPELPFLYVRDFRERRARNAIEDIFTQARKLAPCLLVFEDIDGLVDSYNRTSFLNELDGFSNNDGILVLASSNHPEKIDAALLKRPSRFDRVFHIDLPGEKERCQYLNHLLRRLNVTWNVVGARLACLDSVPSSVPPPLSSCVESCEQLAQQVAQRSPGFTPAYLKEAFMSAALRGVEPDGRVEGERFAAHLLDTIEELRAHLEVTRDASAMAEIRVPGRKMGLLAGHTGD